MLRICSVDVNIVSSLVPAPTDCCLVCNEASVCQTDITLTSQFLSKALDTFLGAMSNLCLVLVVCYCLL